MKGTSKLATPAEQAAPEHVTDEELAAFLATDERGELTLDELQAHEREAMRIAPRACRELRALRAPVDVDTDPLTCAVLDAADGIYPGDVPPGGRFERVAAVLLPHVTARAVLAREAEGLRAEVGRFMAIAVEWKEDAQDARAEIDGWKRRALNFASLVKMHQDAVQDGRKSSAALAIAALQEAARAEIERLRASHGAVMSAIRAAHAPNEAADDALAAEIVAGNLVALRNEQTLLHAERRDLRAEVERLKRRDILTLRGWSPTNGGRDWKRPDRWGGVVFSESAAIETQVNDDEQREHDIGRRGAEVTQESIAAVQALLHDDAAR